ncbi:MAG: S8 family serine peptidase [Bacteroidia bacterium]|nr:S8 family serine peptidase [Bacteroidia bacterium]
MHNRTALVDQEIAQGHKITVDAAGNLYATGEVDQKGSHNFITLALDGGGTLRWEKLWNSPGSGQDAGRAIQISGKAVYVSGNSYGAASTTTTVKYLQKEKNDAIIYSSNGDPAFAAHDLIVRLDTSAIIRAAVNNRGFEAGTLDDFVKPGPAAQLRAAIAALCQSANCDISVFKIFRQLRTDDVSTVSRLGDTIPIPHFWATLLFEFPPAVDVAHAADSLNALFPLVKYTQPNVAIGLNSVNDPLYIEQSSLHPTPHNDTAHINVEPAWALETGKRFVKAGVFDSGIKWNHEDFGDGTANGTKVEGWNFETNSNLKSLANNDNLNHGTPVAGIIGAIRNNNKGVAGIAGGNDPTGTNLDSAGVSLFGMKILDGWFFGYVVLNYVADAMVTSCIDDPTKDYAYGLHVQSHSWHIHEGFDIYFTDTNLTLLSNTSKITSTNQFSFLVFI